MERMEGHGHGENETETGRLRGVGALALGGRWDLMRRGRGKELGEGVDPRTLGKV